MFKSPRYVYLTPIVLRHPNVSLSPVPFLSSRCKSRKIARDSARRINSTLHMMHTTSERPELGFFGGKDGEMISKCRKLIQVINGDRNFRFFSFFLLTALGRNYSHLSSLSEYFTRRQRSTKRNCRSTEM